MKKMALYISLMTLGTALLIWAVDWALKVNIARTYFDNPRLEYILPIATWIGLIVMIFGLVFAIRESKK